GDEDHDREDETAENTDGHHDTPPLKKSLSLPALTEEPRQGFDPPARGRRRGSRRKTRPGAVVLAPANPALPTAGGLPWVVGSPASARAGRPCRREPAGAEGSSHPQRGAGEPIPCSSPITSSGKRRRLRGSQLGTVRVQPRRRAGSRKR